VLTPIAQYRIVHQPYSAITYTPLVDLPPTFCPNVEIVPAVYGYEVY